VIAYRVWRGYELTDTIYLAMYDKNVKKNIALITDRTDPADLRT
jgi:hypothetical protein